MLLLLPLQQLLLLGTKSIIIIINIMGEYHNSSTSSIRISHRWWIRFVTFIIIIIVVLQFSSTSLKTSSSFVFLLFAEGKYYNNNNDQHQIKIGPISFKRLRMLRQKQHQQQKINYDDILLSNKNNFSSSSMNFEWEAKVRTDTGLASSKEVSRWNGWLSTPATNSTPNTSYQKKRITNNNNNNWNDQMENLFSNYPLFLNDNFSLLLRVIQKKQIQQQEPKQSLVMNHHQYNNNNNRVNINKNDSSLLYMVYLRLLRCNVFTFGQPYIHPRKIIRKKETFYYDDNQNNNRKKKCVVGTIITNESYVAIPLMNGLLLHQKTNNNNKMNSNNTNNNIDNYYGSIWFRFRLTQLLLQNHHNKTINKIRNHIPSSCYYNCQIITGISDYPPMIVGNGSSINPSSINKKRNHGCHNPDIVSSNQHQQSSLLLSLFCPIRSCVYLSTQSIIHGYVMWRFHHDCRKHLLFLNE